MYQEQINPFGPDHLETRMKGSWSQLTDDDVALYHSQPDRFFGRLYSLLGIHRTEAEDHIEDLKCSLLGCATH